MSPTIVNFASKFRYNTDNQMFKLSFFESRDTILPETPDQSIDKSRYGNYYSDFITWSQLTGHLSVS